jgi:tripartite-type tricarboxylate transporter receptor subunit TctC
VLSGDVAVGRPIVAPPGVPKERGEALRRAFDAAMRDRSLIANAAQQKLDLAPVGGEELQRTVARIVGVGPEVVARLKQAIAVRDVKSLPPDPAAKGAPAESAE